MSWSSTYPPPPRRSRSRSPRGGYPLRPLYPDSYSDPYRDWDSYDRDRGWTGYERDRVPYDYGRRGRSRSPPPPDESLLYLSHDMTTLIDVWSGSVGRKRRRSMSPYDRERYDPRPRYDDYGLLLLSSLVSFSVSHPIYRFSFALWILWVSASTFGTLQKDSAS
jgi:hypothetical protein